MTRGTVLVVTALALVVALVPAATTNLPATAQQPGVKPNFVFILADDMSKADLRYLPRTVSLLGDGGMTFENGFVSNPLCCPSRATIMRGQYAHNTGVWSNKAKDGGGRPAYENNGLEQDNIATRFDDAGYRTALMGKYLQGGSDQGNTYVPPGWDRWFGVNSFKYFDYNVNDSGTLTHFGRSDHDYVTDVLMRRTKAFIGTSVAQGKPFFAYVAPGAPHSPAVAARRHRHLYDGELAPRPPSFNELDVSDKPAHISSRPLLTPEREAVIDRRHEKRAETLAAVDELVEGVVGRLQEAGALETTYIVFTSDNGWAEGEHRRPRGKANPYEEDIRAPLLFRGPGIPPGSISNELVLNTDYLPTFTDLAGIPVPDYVDGRSLRPLLEESSIGGWRDAILVEGRQGTWANAAPSHSGIRTAEGMKYVEYDDGFRELYDLSVDPYELANSHYVTPPPPLLVARLALLKACSGEDCRDAEDGP